MNCPDCGAELILDEERSGDNNDCVWRHVDPTHGPQNWYDCPACFASWEDEELDV